MQIVNTSKRTLSVKLQYAFGRFKFVRSAYGGFRHFFDGEMETAEAKSVIFPDANVSQIVVSIRKEGVFVGLILPREIIAEIHDFAVTEPLHAIYDPQGPQFQYADVMDGVASDGRPMPVGGIHSPERCPAVKAIIEDPVLRAIVRSYLGNEPKKIMAILDWSFASSMTDDERIKLKHHVIKYHYDVGGLNFVYASFYITDTDRQSGAHIMMRRSHDKKPLHMLLRSAQTSQWDVYREFGEENELVIEGPAGTGFVQDTSCYHRASPPTHGDRLMLALRFIN